MSTTLSKNWTTSATTCTTGSSTTKTNCNSGTERACQQPCRRAARPPRTERQTPDGHVNNLVQELQDAARPAPHPRTIREPTLGLPGAAPGDVIITVVSLCTGLWGPRVRGSLSRRRRHRTVTPSGQHSRRSVAHHRTRHAAPADPWGHPQR